MQIVNCKIVKIMAIGKLYIGRKVRKLREEHQNTQMQFAERIGISTSYLNQIENNQRPVSAAVLLSLAEKFHIDIASLSSGEDDRLLSALSDTLSDPLFENNRASLQELRLIAQNAPSLARALISCHQAYRLASEQLASSDDRLQTSGLSEVSPYEEVRDFFHFVDNYIDSLDKAAEHLAASIGIGENDNHAALIRILEEKYQILVRWGSLDDTTVRRFDAMSKTLTLNPYAPLQTRIFQLAVQLAQFETYDLCEEIINKANFKSHEAEEICRIGLHNYFAGALVLPYMPFLRTAELLRHDIELLAARFGVSLEQVCHRLSTLQRPGSKGVPIFFARVDRAGNITKRHSAAKLQFARFGSACPVWNAHQAFETPGSIIRQLAETPDGVRYLCLAVQVVKGNGGYRSTHPHYALAFGCEISNAKSFVYCDDLDLGNGAAYEAIGISCRICSRTKCANRAVPPLKHRLNINHDLRDVLPYTLEQIG